MQIVNNGINDGTQAIWKITKQSHVELCSTSLIYKVDATNMEVTDGMQNIVEFYINYVVTAKYWNENFMQLRQRQQQTDFYYIYINVVSMLYKNGRIH